MTKKPLILTISFIFQVVLIHANLYAQDSYPPEISGSTMVSYKTTDEAELNMWFFNPPNHSLDDKRPAIVFFFGGGWVGGSPLQFQRHAEYLAARGMVAVLADYRVINRHQVKATACVSDAKSAVRWIRQHAGDLGVDPDRIVASGGSAGGHLAASTAFLPDYDEPSEDMTVSSKPNALVLFNPVLILGDVKDQYPFSKDTRKRYQERVGDNLEKFSPYHHLTEDGPPTIIFHGTGDTTVPYISADIFTEKMNVKGNRCLLVGYEGEEHGFFNFGRKNNGAYIDTVNRMDVFLVGLGYLEAPPAVLTN